MDKLDPGRTTLVVVRTVNGVAGEVDTAPTISRTVRPRMEANPQSSVEVGPQWLA
jgi:hypothetical protein